MKVKIYTYFPICKEDRIISCVPLDQEVNRCSNLTKVSCGKIKCSMFSQNFIPKKLPLPHPTVRLHLETGLFAGVISVK